MRIEAPYHEGELLVQERVGELEQGRRNGAAIADSIIKGALRFIEQQPMIVTGSVDAAGKVWSSVLLGRPGFVRAEDDRTVELHLSSTVLNPHDPFWKNIVHDPRVGMLAIELASRRRLRINGRVAQTEFDQLRVAVEEAYPNCPKYIQRRQPRSDWEVTDIAAGKPTDGSELLPKHVDLLEAADTFFVASANPRGGVDVSHRGGNPGFVHVLNDTTIRIPDYAGNSMYNTLGNFAVNPNAGLAFVDFEGGRLLQMIGQADIQWEVEDPSNETRGTGRYWDFKVDRWVETRLPVEVHWEFMDYSPHNPKATGVAA